MRTRGTGTIWKTVDAHGKPRYTAQIRTPGGRPSKTFGSERAAAQWLTQMKHDMITGEYVEPSQITLGRWWDRWVAVYKSQTVSNATLDSYRYSRARLPKTLLDKPIADIRADHVQMALNGLTGSRRTVEMTRTAIRMCMARAVTDRLIRYNPASATTLPQDNAQHRARALTPSDDAALLKLLTAPCRTIKGKPDRNDQKTQTIRDALYFVRMTGCRRGEAIGLQWGDIGEQVHIRGTKNNYSDRMIPLLPEVRSMLDRRRFTRQSEYVFATSTGKPLDGSNLLRWMSANTDYTVHDLRHTYITRAAQAGVNPKVLQTLTGHARIETLLSVYTHVTDGDKLDAAKKIASGKLLANAK